jgi:small subunit ribosomal protein S15
MNAEKKQKTINTYQLHGADTGSAAVQIALFTERINSLNSQHFSLFPKDKASRTGLVALVGRRQRLLRYLKRSDQKQYEQLILQLGIRK